MADEHIIKKELGLWFDDFKKGQLIFHADDNNRFSMMTMKHHPVHTNVDYASKQQHGKPLVVGTLVFSLVVGITVPDISGKAIANLMYENIDHLQPVFIGDTIYARTEILDVRESKSKPDRGIVYVETTGYNQHNINVLRFRRKVLIKKKPTEL
jgi:acyl dehydratase